MHAHTLPISLGEPSPALRQWMATLEGICIGLTALTACLDLAGRLHGLGGGMASIHWYPMNSLAQLSVWLCVGGLLAARQQGNPLGLLAGRAAAALVVALHLSSLYLLGQQALAHPFPRCSLLGCGIATDFVLLGTTLLLLETSRRRLVFIADLLTISACLLSMVLTTGSLINTLPFFHAPAQQPCAPAGILVSLSLLSLALLLRRTDQGIFSILLSPGIAGGLSRRLTPIILFFPFVREAARARLIGAGHIAPPYITALLASTASIILSCIVLYCAWRIYTMEKELHAVSLHDALTGLYNLRGFTLLAEQSLRIAQRSQLPFAVLFLDLDGLKQTNDTFGHATGSQMLVETGEILQQALRETDVLGHIGGDEFVVAGQFSEQEVTQILDRIEQCRQQKNAAPHRHCSIHFSIGYAMTGEDRKETLATLQARADKAMYAVKRKKKQAAMRANAESPTAGPVALSRN